MSKSAKLSVNVPFKLYIHKEFLAVIFPLELALILRNPLIKCHVLKNTKVGINLQKLGSLDPESRGSFIKLS
jgi:hypothetical protein